MPTVHPTKPDKSDSRAKRVPRRYLQSHRRKLTTRALVEAVSATAPANPQPVVPPSDSAAGEPQGTKPPTNWKTITGRDKPLPDGSLVRTKALQIVAMRIAGQDTEEIARAVGIAPRTVRQYLYLAGRHGWLSGEKFADPVDRLEYELSHKVIDNLNDALDDSTRNENTGIPVKTIVAMKVAEGTLFKKFDQVGAGQAPTMVIGVKIEMPQGASIEMREGTTGGTPNYIEGETQ